jgi:hypothetical protein
MWFFVSSPLVTFDAHYLLKLLIGDYKEILKNNNIKTEEKQKKNSNLHLYAYERPKYKKYEI